MYNVKKNSPRTQTDLRIKISPKKFQETQLAHSNSNEETTLQENHRKQVELVRKNTIQPTAYKRMSNVVQEPDHRKKKLCMVHIP